MQFKGQLLLPDEPGPGLRVNIDVAEHHLAVESDGGGLGAWPLEVVDVERLQGDVFALTVAGEPLRFVADDSISFAYSGIPSIEAVGRRPRTRSALRSMFEWIWNGPEQSPSPTPESIGADAADVSTEQVVAAEAPELEPAGEETHPPSLVEDLPEENAPTMAQTDMPLFDVPIVEMQMPTAEAPSVGCPAMRSDGRRCESPILTSSGFCYPHDPRRAFEDRYQEALDARAQLKRDATERLNRIYNRLEKAMRQVERGDLDPETAMAMAQLASTMCAILDLDQEPPGLGR